MEQDPWDDADDGASGPQEADDTGFRSLPPAPVPAHERAWRHPSELGATTVHLTAVAQPAISRKATVVTVAVGVLLVAGAVRLMLPPSQSGSPVAGSPDGTITLAVTTALHDVTSLRTEPPVATGGDRPAAPTESHAIRSTASNLPTTVGTGGAQPSGGGEYGTVGQGDTAFALVIGSGGYMATTASAVGDEVEVEVHLPSGEVAAATVIASVGPIALLDLSGTTAGTIPHGEPPAAGDTVTVAEPGGASDAVIGDANDLGYPELLSDVPLHETGPVYDAGGMLVGICTHGDDDRSWLVPVSMLDELADAADAAAGGPGTTDEAPDPDDDGSTSTPPTSTTPAVSTSVVTSTEPPTSTIAVTITTVGEGGTVTTTTVELTTSTAASTSTTSTVHTTVATAPPSSAPTTTVR